MALTGGAVTVERAHGGRVATVTLSNGRFNVITWEMRRLVGERFAELEHDEKVNVIVVRSDGEHFSSGGDIAGFMEVEPFDFTGLGHDITAPARSSKPVLVAIDGYCFGVGLELALACDIRLATERSEFALPEIRLGMIPGSGGSQRLTRLIGASRTKFHVLTGTRISARQASDWGLTATTCADRIALDAEVEQLVTLLLDLSPAALRTAKEVLDKGADGPLYTGIELERKAYAMLRATHDFAEGIDAFIAKRPAKFTGR